MFDPLKEIHMVQLSQPHTAYIYAYFVHGLRRVNIILDSCLENIGEKV